MHLGSVVERAAETQAQNLARAKQQEAALQLEVEALSGCASKKKAGECWSVAVTGKKCKIISEDGSDIALNDYSGRNPSGRGNTQRKIVESDDDEGSDASKSPTPGVCYEERPSGGSDEAGEAASGDDELNSVTPIDRIGRLAAETPLIRSQNDADQYLNFKDNDSTEEVLPPANRNEQQQCEDENEDELEYGDDEPRRIMKNQHSSHRWRHQPIQCIQAQVAYHLMVTLLTYVLQQTVFLPDYQDGPEVRGESDSHRDLQGGAHLSQQHSRSNLTASQCRLRHTHNSASTTNNPTRKKSTHQENFENEAPTIKTAQCPSSKLAKKVNVSTSKLTVNIPQEKEWPESSTLTLHPTGHYLRISDQPTEIRSVIQHAIKSATIEVVYHDAYPDPVDAIRKIRKILLGSARALNHTHPMQGFQFIKERIKSPDHGFTDALGKVVTERFSAIHSDAKDVAERCIVGYDLTGTKSICRERVDVLLTQDNYAYPGTWAAGCNGEITRTPDRGKPYAGKPIITCMRALYKQIDPHQHQPDIFVSSSKDHPQELELTPGLVTLTATTVFAVLRDWKSGEMCHSKFEGNTFNRTYKNNLEWMAAARDHNPDNYHLLMHGLYKLIMAEEKQEEKEMENSMPASTIDNISF
ncbi:hypothetical protein E1B28_005319 [Marasmius oreades]|uniref:DUF6532 domain-containing protein n=1 Tax=Marasmius oreades TaxID=181124 RepID=A0A9P7V0H7_9AGAR|nr:uncharacterized protein E1B28_005319 [Marasmius oreades]KAG7098011.1 hypothetical protein E1B28_005319 [Marasmius oreades]